MRLENYYRVSIVNKDRVLHLVHLKVDIINILNIYLHLFTVIFLKNLILPARNGITIWRAILLRNGRNTALNM